ncbi:MAG: signal peptidase I [Candidatus Thorarchaeota archaeon]|jgi:signal peptidase
MERVRQAMRWEQRSELQKTVIVLTIVVLITIGGYGAFMLGMGTTTPLVVVTSESMVPALQPGDLLVLQGRTAENIAVGDIVVYEDDWYTGAPVVHRVVSIETVEDTYYFFTKGDANHAIDPGNRTIDEITGVVVLRIPYLGNVSMFLRTPAGLGTIALIFVAIIVLPEFICKDEDEEKPEAPEATLNGKKES